MPYSSGWVRLMIGVVAMSSDDLPNNDEEL